MATKPSTNNALIKEILKEVKSVQTAIVKIDGRVENLEIWKIASDAGSSAVEKFKAETARAREEKTKMEIFQALLPFIIALTALAYGIITYLGRVR